MGDLMRQQKIVELKEKRKQKEKRAWYWLGRGGFDSSILFMTGA